MFAARNLVDCMLGGAAAAAAAAAGSGQRGVESCVRVGNCWNNEKSSTQLAVLRDGAANQRSPCTV
jgi:hypothetical protein